MNDLVFLFSLPGGAEWILIFLAVLLLFGGRKIPELMRGIGKGIREFNSARSNLKSEIDEGMKEAEQEKKEKASNKAEDKKKSS